MAEQIVSDLLMKFVPTAGGDAIEGDARTALPSPVPAMLKGFKTNYMFEVQSFAFKTGLGGQELDQQADEQKKAHEKTASTLNDHAGMLNDLAGTINNLVDMHNSLASMMNTLGDSVRSANPSLRGGAHGRPSGAAVRSAPSSMKGVDVSAEGIKSSSTRGFEKFRTGKMTQDTRYPVDMKPVEFERAIDLTSRTLLHHCIRRIPFYSATLVKRKPAGGKASGEVFLRFDFHTVLLKSVDWDDGTPVKEKVEFVCRAVTIHYKPQLPDGSLGGAIRSFWKASDKVKIKPEEIK